VLSALKSNSRLQLLDLSDNAISFQGVSDTNWADFSQNRSLRYLLLSGTRIGRETLHNSETIAQKIEKFMLSLPLTLQHLTLARNELKTTDLEKIALVLAKNQSIIHLDISDNYFGFSSAIHLSHIFQNTQNLKRCS
jgi:Ran GTPase-activating protein (RanGAP) involved in mRNA processing and transport